MGLNFEEPVEPVVIPVSVNGGPMVEVEVGILDTFEDVVARAQAATDPQQLDLQAIFGRIPDTKRGGKRGARRKRP